MQPLTLTLSPEYRGEGTVIRRTRHPEGGLPTEGSRAAVKRLHCPRSLVAALLGMTGRADTVDSDHATYTNSLLARRTRATPVKAARSSFSGGVPDFFRRWRAVVR